MLKKAKNTIQALEPKSKVPKQFSILFDNGSEFIKELEALFSKMMADWLINYNTIISHHSLNMKNPVQYSIENHEEWHMLWTNTIH